MRLFDVTDPNTRTLGHALDFQSEHNPDVVWLRTGDRCITYAESAAEVARYREGLKAIGVGPGDIIAIYGRASIEATLIATAVTTMGAAFTVLNIEYTKDFLEKQTAQSTAKVVLVDPDLTDAFDAIQAPAVTQRFILGETQTGWAPASNLSQNPGPAADPIEYPNYLTPAQVLWTSGTTGSSKGVLHSHSGLMMQAYIWMYERAQEGDVSYVCTPFHLSGAWMCGIWSALASGTTAAIDTEFSVSRFWERCRYYDANHIFTLGAMHMYLWNAPETPADADNPVRTAMCIPMSWSLIPDFKKRFGIQTMGQVYGCSEAPMIMKAADDGVTQWSDRAMGTAEGGYEIALLDENDVEVPVGAVGEICIRPTVPGRLFLGYLDAADDTVSAWRNLWHHQGDMAFKDADGVYYFADRKKDYIRYGGRSISLSEVEEVVATHPDVAEVAGYPVKSLELDSEAELALAIVLKDHSRITKDDVARFINDNAPYFFVPRYIDFVDSLPRNSQFKLLRNDLKEAGPTMKAWDRKANGFTVTRNGR